MMVTTFKVSDQPCQRCGEVGGGVLNYSSPSGTFHHSRWLCPHCLEHMDSLEDRLTRLRQDIRLIAEVVGLKVLAD